MKKFLLILFIIVVVSLSLFFLNREGIIKLPLIKKNNKKIKKVKRDEIYLTRIATRGEGTAYIAKYKIRLDFKLKYINKNSPKPDFIIITAYNDGERTIKNLWLKISVRDRSSGKVMCKEYQIVLNDSFKKGEKRKCILNWTQFPADWDKFSLKTTISKIEFKGN